MFKSCLAILLSWCYNTITEVYITPCRGDCVMGKQTYASTPRYRIYPTAQQRQQIDITIDAARFIHNYFLSKILEQWQATGEYPEYRKLQAQLPALRKDYPWLQTATSSAMQAALLHLIRAFKFCDCRRANGLFPGTPHFKSKDSYQQSYRNSNSYTNVVVVGNRVKLPKIPDIKICRAPDICGRIVAATVTREGADSYYISFCYVPENRPLPATGRAVGVDLGIKTYAVTSDGDSMELYHPDKRQLARLQHLRDQLRRQTRGSNRWRKTSEKIWRLNRKFSNRRKDSIHKITSKLVRNYDIICIESLYHQSMMSQNEYRYRAVKYSGWNEFKRQIHYKCEKYGRQLVSVSRFFPSTQLCSVCGYKYPPAKRLTVRDWTCPVCGTAHDRDANAAINILHEGLRLVDQAQAA